MFIIVKEKTCHKVNKSESVSQVKILASSCERIVRKLVRSTLYPLDALRLFAVRRQLGCRFWSTLFSLIVNPLRITSNQLDELTTATRTTVQITVFYFKSTWIVLLSSSEVQWSCWWSSISTYSHAAQAWKFAQHSTSKVVSALLSIHLQVVHMIWIWIGRRRFWIARTTALSCNEKPDCLKVGRILNFRSFCWLCIASRSLAKSQV